IAHGEMIVRPQIAQQQAMGTGERRPSDDITDVSGLLPQPQHSSQATNTTLADVRSLSRREALILRMLMQGASNKVIAKSLVITDSTVKVHMKAILRKLRLQNRTQAALWARNKSTRRSSMS